MNTELIRSGFVVIAIIFLCFISLREKQNTKLNWSIFYSSLYTIVSLPLVNLICTHLNLWQFTNDGIPSPFIPSDILFVWVVAWGVIPIFFLEKKHFPILLIAIFWIDFLLMPLLERYGILSLSPYWLIGELLLILFVFVPAYLWAYVAYRNIYTGIRAVFQVFVMIGIFIVGLPYVLHNYGLLDVQTGKGTPFPYDKTDRLVTNGVYAYCRNPIQWSFTLMFVCLAMYHSSYYFLIGSIVAIAYSIGVADFHESADMKTRFGVKWTSFINHTPRWYFQWKPKGILAGTIYFDTKCSQCSAIADWFRSKDTQNLTIEAAYNYEGPPIQNVTYVTNDGEKYESTKAIARALEHINLGYAVVGWFIRFIGINFILQAIVNTMDVRKINQTCEK